MSPRNQNRKTKAEVRRTHMVHCSPATAPPYEGNAGATQSLKIHFLPWILISSYDDAWFITIDEQEWLLDRLLPEQPARQHFIRGRMDENAGALERTSLRMRG